MSRIAASGVVTKMIKAEIPRDGLLERFVGNSMS
jgi:hypothetical protein